MNDSGYFDDPDITFWRSFSSALENDDGSAAKNRLSEGKPIYIRENDTPLGHVIKIYPDGRRELIFIDDDGTPSVIKSL